MNRYIINNNIVTLYVDFKHWHFELSTTVMKRSYVFSINELMWVDLTSQRKRKLFSFRIFGHNNGT